MLDVQVKIQDTVTYGELKSYPTEKHVCYTIYFH